jgi:hypothetical protein
MKKDVVFWIGVNSDDTLLRQKHGNFEYLEYSKKTWKYWCNKHNVIFYEYSTPAIKDTGKHKVTWQRWFDVFEQIENANIDYRKILVTDGSIMVKWNMPNIFDLVSDELQAFKSLENIKWINEGITGYSELFDNHPFDLKQYISCGFQIFTKKHKEFLSMLKEYYFANESIILNLQNNIVKRGTDQPVYNYLLQINNIKVNQDLPDSFWLMHMSRFNWLSYNWQLNEDFTPYFIKYGYIWVFSGFDRTQRLPLMKQTWDLIYRNYE